MKATFHLLIACFVLLLPPVFATQKVLYKIVNADGSVTYTDVKQPGAIAVDASSVKGASMPALATPPPPAPAAQSKPQQNYQLRINQPQPEASIRSNNGDLTINGLLSPAAAGTYRLLMDGKLFSHSQDGEFSLQNIDRGEHSIQIQFIDNSGKILASSPTQRLYLHRASLLINRN